MVIYIYKKIHNKTGLQYLGKTVSKDPHQYPGSGTYWRKHLEKYGYDYTTEILCECGSKQEAKEKGLYYSRLWNVVESKEWANLKKEEGDGGLTRTSFTPGHVPWNKGKTGTQRCWRKGKTIDDPRIAKAVKVQSESLKKFYKENPDRRPIGEKNGMYGKKHTKEFKEGQRQKFLLNNPLAGRFDTAKGKKWYVFEDGEILYTRDTNHPKFQSGIAYKNGRKW